jgi:hypothetical protein
MAKIPRGAHSDQYLKAWPAGFPENLWPANFGPGSIDPRLQVSPNQTASDDALKRGLDMTREVIGRAFQDSLKNLIRKDDTEIETFYREISAEKDPLKIGAMQKRWEQLDLNKAHSLTFPAMS